MAFDQLKEQFEELVNNSESLKFKWSKSHKFEIVSRNSFGPLRMTEKEPYSISGKFVPKQEGSELHCDVKSNPSYRIMGIMIPPLMLLPIFIIGIIPKNGGIGSNPIFGMSAYLILAGSIVGFILLQERKIIKKGGAEINKLVVQLKTANPGHDED